MWGGNEEINYGLSLRVHSSFGKRNRKIVMRGHCSNRASTSFLERMEERVRDCACQDTGRRDHILR